jgi:type IV pilus assembly protein PilN
MRNIEASGWMTNPDLSVIEVKGSDKTLPYAFNLSLTMVRPGQQLGPDGQPLPDTGNSTSAPTGGATSSPSSQNPAASGSSAAASPAAPAPAAAAPSAASSKKGGSTP